VAVDYDEKTLLFREIVVIKKVLILLQILQVENQAHLR
jgi:hypothetical protein